METTTLTPQQIKELKISEKIWRVQHEIKSLIKDEVNKFQNYKYFDENQILKVLKPLLEKYHLLMLISDDDAEPFHYEREGTNHYIKYLKKMELTDLDEKTTQIYKF
jgi:ERF superfamily